MPRNGSMDWEVDENAGNQNEGAINGNETGNNGIPQGIQSQEEEDNGNETGTKGIPQVTQLQEDQQ